MQEASDATKQDAKGTPSDLAASSATPGPIVRKTPSAPIRFCHLADCHVGGWRDPRMRKANMEAFQKAMTFCRQQAPDFIIIAGDLFNTSLPPLDALKDATTELRKLRESDIRVYAIAGSHDYSPTGKSILHVLEEAGLLTNLTKGTIIDGKLRLKPIQDKSGAWLTGILGRRGMLDKRYYEDLDREPLESLQGYKVFAFHTALEELKSRDEQHLPAAPVSLLPRAFHYYAGGHVHIVKTEKLPSHGAHATIAYPGPTFPNNFSELEDVIGGVNVVTWDGTHQEVTWHPISVYNVHNVKVDVTNMTPAEAHSAIQNQLHTELIRTIVTIRLRGKLQSGSIADIALNDIMQECYADGAHFVMRNTSGMQQDDEEQMSIAPGVPDVEQAVIKEHLEQGRRAGLDWDTKQILALMDALAVSRNEGETVSDFEARMNAAARQLLEQP
ncbi:hypothetical protein COY28_06780 [Candidatus Woesearchaeota archaeon CG_4_10_14_0_2_um_filter_57_5]|nr:MAG: hypothetical protein AUJ68_07285 [Candidatus Woesearchaeota archaeon CG1_02_57_44]PIN68422.1 MAG: hypothetical protein COV94_04720 [Candidatus Woesearchaeota archaeon CG11_big_fil_rev_8_21_14_0_20_57_5]PIZ48912.1 MAG: hypothetical protein COY28_06780 [Candidatus Woesearchaeota archaeon CG_4_10_14_0_2_um_filter_57_5]